MEDTKATCLRTNTETQIDRLYLVSKHIAYEKGGKDV